MGLGSNLNKYTDQQLWAEVSRLLAELHKRKNAAAVERAKTAKCCYCGKSMDDKESCPSNPFSDYHVE